MALGLVLAQGLGNATVYFRTADEAAAQRSQLGTRRFRIEGVVVPGSVHQTGNEVAFSIASHGVSVPVAHRGDPPELFRAGIPVVLEGHFSAGQPTFLSDLLMVKHSENYQARHPERVTTPPAPADQARQQP
ncbi:MAG: cytochrome c maturation protein CcmE [Acidimicrobiales bacterium]